MEIKKLKKKWKNVKTILKSPITKSGQSGDLTVGTPLIEKKKNASVMIIYP